MENFSKNTRRAGVVQKCEGFELDGPILSYKWPIYIFWYLSIKFYKNFYNFTKIFIILPKFL